MPEEMVLEGELIHHGREHVKHGGVGHLGVLDVEDHGTLSSEDGCAKISGIVTDRASEEEEGMPVLTSGVCGIIAICRGNGVL